jgi:hypothetical protein
MSAKVMGAVWDADLPRDQKFILLAYADHAEHDGSNIYPSVPKIAWKTGYSERQVQRITKELIDAKIMVRMGDSHLGTHLYRINMKALPQREEYVSQRRGRPNNGDNMSPISEDNGDIPAQNGDILAKNGDIAMSPEPSFNPSIKPKRSSSVPKAETLPEPKQPPTPPPAPVEEPLPLRPDIYTLYEQELGALTPMLAQMLDLIERDYPQGWFADAVKEAKLSSSRGVSLKYVDAILKRWKSEGRSVNNVRKAPEPVYAERW